jgi:hypothetical protein
VFASDLTLLLPAKLQTWRSVGRWLSDTINHFILPVVSVLYVLTIYIHFWEAQSTMHMEMLLIKGLSTKSLLERNKILASSGQLSSLLFNFKLKVLSVLSINLPICRQEASTLVYWCPPIFQVSKRSQITRFTVQASGLRFHGPHPTASPNRDRRMERMPCHQNKAHTSHLAQTWVQFPTAVAYSNMSYGNSVGDWTRSQKPACEGICNIEITGLTQT